MTRTFMLSLIFALPMLHATASAGEYFGVFTDGPVGRFITEDPRPEFELSDRFAFEDPNKLVWEVPSGTRVNGASIPQAFWSAIGGPFDGNYLKASVIHDHFCTTRSRTAHDTHRNFYYGMRANGVEDWKAKAMYWAVSTFGPDWTLESRIEDSIVCRPDATGQSVCVSTPELVTRTVVSPGVDLADPETLSVATGKFAAVVRTLKTSEGATLDVLSTGMVDGTIGSIETNASSTRGILATKSYRSDPSTLGIVLEPKQLELDAVTNWPDNKLPKYLETLDLDKPRDGSLPANKPFILERGDIERFQLDMEMSPTRFNLPLNQ